MLLFEDAEAPGDELGMLIDVLRSAAEFWAGARQAVLRGVHRSGSAALALPDLFTRE